MSYRVEVELKALKGDQERQFRQAARESGFNVAPISNGWALAINNLSEKQAAKIRDGLARLGIHSSIGIS